MRLSTVLTTLGSIVLGIAAQEEALNFTANAIEDLHYEDETCSTALCTVYVTRIEKTTIFSTVTKHKGTTTTTETDISLSTEWATTTTTTTFATSYPAATTTIIKCEQSPDEPGPTYKRRTPEHDTPICLTETITEWSTTTTTTVSTKLVPTVVPTTIAVPTTVPITIPTTITTTRSTTIWHSTTYTTTAEITSDRTVVRTVVSTVVTSVPVVSYATEVVTETVTAPGEIITLPGQATTLPGSTVVSTIIVEGPEKTATLTEDGETLTTTIPPWISTTTKTNVIPPSIATAPDTTIIVTPVLQVSLCPMPTASARSPGANSNLTFGCEPGFVCNPPKPDDCNFWPDLPSKDYMCEPSRCIPAPLIRDVPWEPGKTGYYPPAYGYFDLNPEHFGLSYEIFEYHIEEKVENGHTTTRTTGNWDPQTSLSSRPRPTQSTSATAEIDPYTERLLKKLMKRQQTPSICFNTCNNAARAGQLLGKTPELCDENSSFFTSYEDCQECISSFLNVTMTNTRDYVESNVEQWLAYCDGLNAGSPSATAPESIVTEAPTIITSEQGGVSSGPFTPFPPTSNTTSSSVESSTPSSTGPVTPVPTGTGALPTGSLPTGALPSSSSPTVIPPVVSSPVVIPPESGATHAASTGIHVYSVAATAVCLLLGFLLV